MNICQYLQMVLLLTFIYIPDNVVCMSKEEKNDLRKQVLEMFHHAYRSYMDYAYPADELMPLSCKGRFRGTEPSRGDVDDSLGNFSLTLIDTLDTLVVLGELDEFEKAARLVINGVSFDSDIVVSVFETNIRVLGGLLGGHVMARYLKSRKKGMDWYRDELLEKAKDIGYRLLPAFNTTTGMPYPRVNLRYGVKDARSRTGSEKDTCTACAGTMILEFSALSRLSGDPIFEEKAHKAMEYLWHSRHRSSDLVGTVINIHNGDWVRRDSGVGAGIDSYYEYVLKAYILLGDETYLERFNKHYAGIRKYVTQGPMLVDVHMHKPFTNSRNFMDALLAFWPGLLTLIGDMKPAIETHEMLYQVMQRHSFLPEAFTTDFRVHWAQHPLRPEFLESTYFLYKATGDSHYLEVGKEVLENLNSLARVKCGFAAIKDVTAGTHEDQMDSYVLAETFKYLYLLFSEPDDLILNIDNFIFTTEAHLLPLSLSIHNTTTNGTKMPEIDSYYDDDRLYERTCPNTNHVFDSNYAKSFRDPLKNMVDSSCPASQARCGAPHVRPPFAKTSECNLNNRPRLKASEFVAGSKIQLETLARMGISVMTMKDGRVQLLHTASEAASSADAEDGMLFMQEMIELSKSQSSDVQHEPRVVQYMTPPYDSLQVLNAGPAQFGYDLKKNEAVKGKLTVADPIKGCETFRNLDDIRGRIAIMERGECMFIDKARQLQEAGAIGGLIIDSHEGTSSSTQPLFAMSGDGKNDVTIPLLFLFHEEGQKLIDAHRKYDYLQVYLGYESKRAADILTDLLTDPEQNSKIQENADVDLSQDLSHSSQSDASLDDQYNDLHEAGGIEFDFRSESTPQVEVPTADIKQADETFIQMISGPDDTKHVRLHLDKVKPNKENLQLVVEKLVEQLIEHTNFASLEGNDKYLIAIAKMLDAIAQSNYNLIDAYALNTLEKLNTVLKPKEKVATEDNVSDSAHESLTFKERLAKKMESTLDAYISAELKKIIQEADSFKDDVKTPKISDNSEEGFVASKIAMEELESYATEEELANYGLVQPGGKFEKGGGKYKRYLPPNVQQAPEWLSLESGQVIIAKDGNIYADLKDSYWDWARDEEPQKEPGKELGKEPGKEPGQELGKQQGEDSGFESEDDSDLFLSAYSTKSGSTLKSKEELDAIRTDDPDNWDLELAVFEHEESDVDHGEDITAFGQKQSDYGSQNHNIRDSHEHLSQESDYTEERTSGDSSEKEEL